MAKKNVDGAMFIKSVVKDKRGLSYIEWACVILFLIILIAFIMSFMIAVDTIESQRAYAKHQLDSYVEDHAIDIYKQVKQSDSKGGRLTGYNDMMTAIIDDAGLVYDSEISRYIHYTEEGKQTYRLSPIGFSATKKSDKMVEVHLTYTITVPVRFMGATVVWVDVPLDIVSEFTPKFG